MADGGTFTGMLAHADFTEHKASAPLRAVVISIYEAELMSHALTARALLQQAPVSVPHPTQQCTLAVGNALPENFQDCSAVSINSNAAYAWYYTLTPGPNGTTWRGVRTKRFS